MVRGLKHKEVVRNNRVLYTFLECALHVLCQKSPVHSTPGIAIPGARKIKRRTQSEKIKSRYVYLNNFLKIRGLHGSPGPQHSS